MLIIAENHIKPQDNSENELEKICKKMIRHTRSQPGCISYSLYQDLDNPYSLMFVEEWETEEDLNAHLNDEKFIEIYKYIEKCLIKDEVMKKYKVFVEV